MNLKKNLLPSILSLVIVSNNVGGIFKLTELIVGKCELLQNCVSWYFFVDINDLDLARTMATEHKATDHTSVFTCEHVYTHRRRIATINEQTVCLVIYPLSGINFLKTFFYQNSTNNDNDNIILLLPIHPKFAIYKCIFLSTNQSTHQIKIQNQHQTTISTTFPSIILLNHHQKRL